MTRPRETTRNISHGAPHLLANKIDKGWSGEGMIHISLGYHWQANCHTSQLGDHIWYGATHQVDTVIVPELTKKSRWQLPHTKVIPLHLRSCEFPSVFLSSSVALLQCTLSTNHLRMEPHGIS